jgi:hypothetical protein
VAFTLAIGAERVAQNLVRSARIPSREPAMVFLGEAVGYRSEPAGASEPQGLLAIRRERLGHRIRRSTGDSGVQMEK